MLGIQVIADNTAITEADLHLANTTAWPGGKPQSTHAVGLIQTSTRGFWGRAVSVFTIADDLNATTNSPKKQEASTVILTDYVVEKIYIAIGSIGIIGNAFTCIVMLSSRTLRKHFTNLFILNQSMLDGMAAVFLMLSTVFEDNGRYLSGLADQLLCSIWYAKAQLWGMYISSTYNLLSLSIERYMKVVHPIFHRVHFNKTKFYIIIVAVWIIGPLYSALYMIPTSKVVDGVCRPFSDYPSAAAQKTAGIINVIFVYIIPLIVIIYVYSRMAFALRSRKVGIITVTPNTADHQASEAVKTEQQHKMNYQRRTIKTLAIVCGVFIMCWSWNQLYYLFYNFGYPMDFGSNFYHFTVIAVFLNCCLNPLIYALKYKAFQTACRQFMCGWRKSHEPNSSTCIASTHNQN